MRLSITLISLFLLIGTMATAQKRHGKKENITDLRDTILWRKVVMREIDLRYSGNKPLLEMADSNGNKVTINKLFYDLVKNNRVATRNLVGDTIRVDDSVLALLTGEISVKDTTRVYKYVVVEEWAFDRKNGNMVVYVKWIGPYLHGCGKSITNRTDTKIPCERATFQPFFAVEYSDLRRTIEQYHTDICTGKKMRTWDMTKYFEDRQYKSKITCEGPQNYNN